MYAMVTLSPTLGMGPLPSLRIVLVTPMIAAVREKPRGAGLENVVMVERNVVRIFGKEESMGTFSGSEGKEWTSFMARRRVEVR